jgi:hypothetical protein
MLNLKDFLCAVDFHAHKRGLFAYPDSLETPIGGTSAAVLKFNVDLSGNFAVEDFMDHLKVVFMCIDVGLRDEPSQVHGYVTVLDFTEFTSGHVGCLGMENMRKMMKSWQVRMRQPGLMMSRNSKVCRTYEGTPTKTRA